MTQEERASDMATRLFEAIALRVDQFFKAKNIQGGVRRGDDLFSPMNKHELTKSLLLFADEIRTEAAEKAERAIEHCPMDKYEGRMILPGLVRFTITGKDPTP